MKMVNISDLDSDEIKTLKGSSPFFRNKKLKCHT